MKKIKEFLIFSILFFAFNAAYDGKEFKEEAQPVYYTQSDEKMAKLEKMLKENCHLELCKIKQALLEKENENILETAKQLKNLKKLGSNLNKKLENLEKIDPDFFRLAKAVINKIQAEIEGWEG